MSTTAEKIKELQNQIEVMQAFDDGKQVQYRNIDVHDEWLACPIPIWEWQTCGYRINPEPKVIFINEYEGSGHDSSIHHTKHLAEQYATKECPRIAIKYIEVIED